MAVRYGKMYHVICVLLLLCILAGCGQGEPEETTFSSSLVTGQLSTAPDQPSEQAAGPAFSTELWISGDDAIYVDPIDKRIKCLDTATEELSVLFENRVYGEFIPDGEFVWFCDSDSGRVVAGNMQTGDVTEYYRMPLGRGIKFGSVIYFIDEGDYSDETALYRYDTENGEWENRVMSGNRQSPNRRTVEFGMNGVWYISAEGGVSSLCSIAYGTWETKVVYSSESENGIFELVLSDGVLYFADSGVAAYSVRTGSGEAVEYLSGASRVYGKSADGILFQRTYGYPEKLYVGDAVGNAADVSGGHVISSYGSRAVLRRISDGEECLVVVKYPEDTETFSLECSLFASLTNGRYVLAFVNDSRHIYFFDLESGEVRYFETERLLHDSVSIDEYLLNGGGLVCPSKSALAEASAAEVASVFSSALRKNDRYTLNAILGEGEVLEPFESFVLKSCRAVKQSEDAERAVFSLEYDYLNSADPVLLAYMPGCVRKGSLVLRFEEGVWKVDADAS